jgi:signal peptidase II
MIGKTAWHLALTLAVLSTIGCDRVTKHAAATFLSGLPSRSYLADTVRLGYAENTGGFLSLGAELPSAVRTGLFTVGTGLLLCMLVFIAIRRRWDRLSTLGLALFVAGGASNWIDRVTRGSVVDFLNVGVGPVRTGVFNVADVAIMLGAGVIVIATFGKKQASSPPGTRRRHGLTSEWSRRIERSVRSCRHDARLH